MLSGLSVAHDIAGDNAIAAIAKLKLNRGQSDWAGFSRSENSVGDAVTEYLGTLSELSKFRDQGLMDDDVYKARGKVFVQFGYSGNNFKNGAIEAIARTIDLGKKYGSPPPAKIRFLNFEARGTEKLSIFSGAGARLGGREPDIVAEILDGNRLIRVFFESKSWRPDNYARLMRNSLHAVGNGNGTGAGQLRLDMLKMFNDTVDDAGNIRDSDEIVRWLFDGRLKNINITEARIKNVVREQFQEPEFTFRFLQQSAHPGFRQIDSAMKARDLIESDKFRQILDNILDSIFDGSTG